MIWFTWRQFRTQTWIAVAALAAVGVLLVVTGRSIADAYEAAGVAGCDSDCASAVSTFLRQATTGTNGTVYNLAELTMYLVPALIGIFWGAPLIARELETGTHRLAWNQSVTRTRWLASKLAIIGAAAAAITGLLSWAVTTWAQHVDQAAGDRITPVVFGARGIVPIGYALFAFALGVIAGMLIRRTIPAMAATLAGYLAIVASMQLWIRERLTPADHATSPLNPAELQGMMIQDGSMEVIGPEPGNAWVLSNQTISPNGQPFTGPADPQACGPDAGVQACEDWIGTLGLRHEVSYHPTSHFWSLQWIEAGILVALAVALAGFCFWWTRRRLT